MWSPILGKRFFASVILILSVLAGWQGFARLFSALVFIPVEIAVEKINTRNEINRDKLVELIDSAQGGIRWDDSARHWEQVSVLSFQLAQQQGFATKEGLKTLRSTQNQIKQSLLRAPNQAYLWYRLALVEVLLKSSSKYIAELLINSVMLGANELGYLMPRLSFCLLLLDEFSEADKDLLRRQVLIAWQSAPNKLTSYFTTDETRLNAIKTLLATQEPEILADILRVVAKQKKK
jgi:hypothetical protein